MYAHNLLLWRFREVGLKQSFSLVVEEATFDLSKSGESWKIFPWAKLRLLSRTAAKSV